MLNLETRNTLLTGSQATAEKLAVELHGKVSLDDAGFDRKILVLMLLMLITLPGSNGAYATIGQKCSA